MQSALPDLNALRKAMTRIEGLNGAPSSRDRCEKDGHRSRHTPLGPTGFRLDGLLGGGLKRGTLHEIVADTPRDEASASRFAVALAGLCTHGRTLIWIVDDRAAGETGTPYRPGLAAQGLDPDKLVLVRTRDTHTTLWAAEEALRSGAAVVLMELWRTKAYDLAASRRLLLAAQRRGATSLVVHVGLGRDDTLSSSAESRFSVAAAPSDYLRPAGATAKPIPGPAGFAVRLVKRRGAAEDRFGAFDPHEVHRLVWDASINRFRVPVDPAPAWRQAVQDWGGAA